MFTSSPKEPVIGPYLEADVSSSHPPSLSPNIHFNIILPSMPMESEAHILLKICLCSY
jgi:hypothetical protein